LGLVVLVIIAVVVLAMILRSQAFALKLGRWLDRIGARVHGWLHWIPAPHMTASLPDFRTAMVGLLRNCWKQLTVAEGVSQLMVVLVLGVACRMQGLENSTISWAVILVA
jgi:hypothetical protein